MIHCEHINIDCGALLNSRVKKGGMMKAKPGRESERKSEREVKNGGKEKREENSRKLYRSL